ncbi:endoplasmic reticulum-resident kdel protein [Purpureocillium lilacinum]|uniref:CAZyme family GT90 n=1 Tax=Purpureocillium lilacinum TaxID=33203 RepID=A0A179GUA5_PURLI|nr:endoplasmic reticulum-resident kdel protein [Purpureocillium lilacinum]KAK4087071.1 CAZyme family GT90 [Purpureocillium lilacinum]OAQ81048.1 endoplasmic reticulum-resident kdel protein [Purpureocillium lilacinum]
MLKLCDPRLWPSRLVVRYLSVAFFVAFLVANYILWHDTKSWDMAGLRSTVGVELGHKHPIKKLMVEAKLRHEKLLASRSHDVADAAAKYRSKRGRHPPPGFDAWFKAALDADAIVVEDYFDRIYKDLTPFWALDPNTTSRRANAWHWVVKVRNGTASYAGDVEGRVPWLQHWTGLVKEFAEHMPDVDMPVNMMDESRILVPHDQVAKLVEQERKERALRDVANVTSKFTGLKHVDEAKPDPYDPEWFGPSNQFWDLAVKTCGPDTPAYGVKQIEDFAAPAAFPQDYRPSYSYKGFVQNWTAATDPCLQPHLRQLHGTFIEPISLSSTEELIPMFGGSKLPMNNEILIPGAMYLTQDEFYSGGDSHGPSWGRKKDGLIWRGDGSGGRPKEHTWHHFQRHRLVDMFNGTTVSRAESEGKRALTFEFPSTAIYDSPRTRRGELGAWISQFADTAFVHLCAENECDFFAPHFKLSEQIPMKKQYNYKFLPDADGNSFSARFRGFLRSTSLPLKATVYAEWHDDRIVPWVHFVPLDNTFQDIFPVLEYFADGSGPGDAAAQFIAEMGREWSEKVLRREDMRLYVWRLLLEWARVCDENRHALGYVDDLKKA